ncbi:MAG: hypothetical protein L0332_17300 [Chloroflexi bacterium]|nr:hypothetical protein [Chloroflexota bacterium]MCI0643742.1 hypothetical protein [Chloroflexota bacterium]MCI0728457.1 hypothetical protein [Chloroflexota bacterium]
MSTEVASPAEMGRPAAGPARRRKALNVLVPLALTLVSVAASLEVGLRVFFRLIPIQVCGANEIIGNYYCQPYLVYDKPIRIGYRYKPGYHFEGWWDPANPYAANREEVTAPTGRSEPFWYTFQADEMGFPNDRYEWQDHYDVVITGDSFTIRTSPQTWIELLEERTGKSILTLGASSWSTLNEVEAVKLYGLDKSPEWVIVMYFEGNDLINTAQYVERRDSGLSWKEFDMQRSELADHLLTWHLARYLAGRTFPAEEAAGPPRYRYPVTASTEAGPVDVVFKDIHLLPISANYDTLARSNEFQYLTESLVELQQLAAARGTRLLLVYIPSKEHVYWSRIWDPVDVNNILERTVTVTLNEGDHGWLRWNPGYLSYDVFQANHDDQERLFEAWTQQAGIEFLNLTPILWQETIARGELYHYADPHWNQAGNQLIADLITAYIEGMGEGR